MARRESEHAGQLSELKKALETATLEAERLRKESAESRNQCTAASEALKASQENIAEQRNSSKTQSEIVRGVRGRQPQCPGTGGPHFPGNGQSEI